MEFTNLAGEYTCSQFLSGSNSVVTATSEGVLIVWEPLHERTGGSATAKESKSKKKSNKAATKVSSFWFLVCAEKFLVILSQKYNPDPTIQNR